jgi:hypothetical protein
LEAEPNFFLAGDLAGVVEGSFWPATSGALNEKGKKIGVIARVAHGGRNPFLPMKTLCAVLLLVGAVGRAAEIPTPNFRAVDRMPTIASSSRSWWA